VTAALLALLLLVPTLRVAPSTDLVDGQVVRIRGTSFPAGTTVQVRQCTAPSGAPSTCFESTVRFAPVDASGTFETDLPVRRVIRTADDDRVDCAGEPGRCLAVAIVVDHPNRSAAVPLAFDPDVPAMAPLAVDFTVDATSAVDRATGDALLTGTVRCNRRAATIVQVELSQEVHGRLLVVADFVEGRCGPTARTWAVRLDTGPRSFRPGDAFAETSVDVSTEADATGATVNRAVVLEAAG
jgi:Neocarzinostatin family